MEHFRKAVILLLFFSISLALLYVSRDLMVPLLMGGLLAMLFLRPSRWLEQKSWPRWLTSLTAIGILILGITLIISLLGWQISQFSEHISEMKSRFTDQFEQMRNWIQTQIGISPEEQKQLLKAEAQTVNGSSGSIATFATGTLSALLDVILVLAYTFLLLYYRSKIKQFILEITPSDKRTKTQKILQEATGVTQQYLMGLLSMILALWVLFGIGFSLVGVEGALFFAVLCGIMEIVPFVGNLLGTSITLLAVLAQGGDGTQMLLVIVVYIIVQGIQTYLLEPLIVGNHVNINPLFIIIVLVAGELLWGIAGMVVAIPLIAIMKIVFDRIEPLQPYGRLIGSEKPTQQGRKFKQKTKEI
jgi:predicted PurR-regulated permease PerM